MKNDNVSVKEPPAVDLLLQSGPPPHLLFRFIERNVIKQLRFDLTVEQCSGLGAALIKLAGATEARAGEDAVSAAPRPPTSKPASAGLGCARAN